MKKVDFEKVIQLLQVGLEKIDYHGLVKDATRALEGEKINVQRLAQHTSPSKQAVMQVVHIIARDLKEIKKLSMPAYEKLGEVKGVIQGYLGHVKNLTPEEWSKLLQFKQMISNKRTLLEGKPEYLQNSDQVNEQLVKLKRNRGKFFFDIRDKWQAL